MYHDLVVRVGPDGRDKLDAALGDPAAQARLDAERAQDVDAAGFEVG